MSRELEARAYPTDKPELAGCVTQSVAAATIMQFANSSFDGEDPIGQWLFDNAETVAGVTLRGLGIDQRARFATPPHTEGVQADEALRFRIATIIAPGVNVGWKSIDKADRILAMLAATPSAQPEGSATSAGERAAMERALLMAAPGKQGGHSEEGMAIAEALGLPFPLSMDTLRPEAIKRGYMPYDLWPWLQKLDDRRASAPAAFDGGKDG